MVKVHHAGDLVVQSTYNLTLSCGQSITLYNWLKLFAIVNV